jgi:hypothetical protein
LGMVRWLRWFSNQGHGPAHPFQALEPKEVVSSGNFHHCTGRELNRQN